MTLPDYANEDGFLWLARDLPNPSQYAAAMLMTRRDLARELLAAKRGADGTWKFRYDPHSTQIAELRGLGLCDVAGTENAPTPSGPGWHVTSYGLVIRNRLLQLLSTRELEHPLENDEDEAAE